MAGMQEYCQPKYYNFGVQLYLLDVIWYSQILYKLNIVGIKIMNILITGGAGFIGSALIRHII